MSQQLQITGGAKVRDLQDVIIGTSGVLSSLAFNVANGVPKLDVNGKILVSQLPNSVMEYQGTWNAATNTPTLVNGTGNQGDVYLCNVAGTTNFGAGPITFAVGDSAIYSGTIWQRAGGATGTVTSVGLTSTGNDAITITGSPITTSGNINLGFAGTNLQYINGAGDLTTFPTLISSIGLTMPSAFSVANSPLTANGTIAVTGAGYPSQYIRGDGTLADFPTSGGGGSSVSYYLNGGTSQGTIGGVTYYEMSKTADTGTGVDFTKSGDGFIVAFLTDAGDPAQLNIPAGNWNYEIYASMSANGGTPEMYAELYKYDGTTFTLISTSSNEILYDGTNLNLYTFAMTVPSTTLAITDRLAVKLYATNSGGKTTTVHTQDSHLCQIITTFSTGITALNGLTAQVQYFATGTSGTDFNISSSTATHTFNIPSASATNRGLITTGSQTIAGDKAFTGINSFDYGINYKTGASLANVSGYISQAYATSGTGAGSTLSLKISDGNSVKAINLDFVGSPATYTYTFPAATGTLALTSNLSSYVPYTGATTNVDLGIYSLTGNSFISMGNGASSGVIALKQNGAVFASTGYAYIGSESAGKLNIYFGDTGLESVILDNSLLSADRTYNFPNASGTIALTSDIPSLANYVTLNTIQTISANKTFSEFGFFDKGVLLKQNIYPSASGYNGIGAISGGFYFSLGQTTVQTLLFNTSTPYQYTFPSATGTLALTSNLSSYVPLAGNVNVTGPLGINTTGGSGTTGLTNFGTFITRSDSTQGFPRKLAISMASGTLVSIDASGNGANYITDMAFSTSTSSGLNATPAIYITGTNNRVGIKTGTPAYDLDVSGTLRNTTSAYFATTSGNVGIGTVSPTIYGGGLEVSRASQAGVRVSSTGTGAGGVELGYSGGAAYIQTVTAGSDLQIVTGAASVNAMILKASGNVGIGTSSPQSNLQVLGTIKVATGNAQGILGLGEANGTSVNCGIYRGAANAPTTDGNFLNFGGYDGLVFTTGAAVIGSQTERMRITSGGNVMVGYAGNLTDTRMYISAISDTSSNYALVVKQSNNTQNLFFIRDDGYINTGTRATSPYNLTTGSAANMFVDSGGGLNRSTSSLKYKKDVKDYDKGLAEVMQLRPVFYKGISDNDGDKQFAGLIAEEVDELGLTEFVQYAEDGTPDALAYSNMVALLVKAIQEMNTKLDEQNQTIQNLQEQINAK